MRRLAAVLAGLLVPAALITAGVGANQAMAQGKGKEAKTAPAAQAEKGKATIKVLVDNDKVRVTEVHFRPGDVNTEDRSTFRVNRTLQGGTLQRTYADGRKEILELKAGTVRYNEPAKGADNYTVKNIGKTTVINYVVRLK